MRLVILESPYAADTPEGVESNVNYALDCLSDSLARGEAPIASHLLHTRVLDDTVPGERELGINAGLAWASKADAMVVYHDRGMSRGMVAAIHHAILNHLKVEYRLLEPAKPRLRLVEKEDVS
jgi:hypothetical protein